MKIISHRGNLNGPDPLRENTPEAVEKALGLGFDVEIDVWGVGGVLWLGHDHPTEILAMESNALPENNLWVHCKNLPALEICLSISLHCFSHEKDPYVLTSRGFVWCYPGLEAPPNLGIQLTVGSEKPSTGVLNAYGVCTDHPFELILG